MSEPGTWGEIWRDTIASFGGWRAIVSAHLVALAYVGAWVAIVGLVAWALR